jgi:hypothetical protein
MNTYQLDDKTMDDQFLSGKPVACPAVVPAKQTEHIQQGQRIVVLLSNGKKYMGEVLVHRYSVRNGVAEGVLEIIRYPRIQ